MKDVFLTIIIPTYKRSDNLDRAINSIINQEGSFEIIVVDDNDSDSVYRIENEKIMEKYNNINNIIYLKHEKNKNGASARNTGIKKASGKYITFLDDDDEFDKNRISSIESVLKNSDIDFACSGFIIKRNGVVKVKKMPDFNYSNKELQYMLLCQESFFGTGSNIICRKDIVNKINGFDVNFIRHQDMEFVIRVLDVAKKIAVIEDYSIIKNSDENNNIPNVEKLYEVKKKYLDKLKK